MESANSTSAGSSADARQKSALVTGITGQDGAYLALLLLDKGYRVTGTSRDAGTSNLRSLVSLGIAERVKLISMAPEDFKSTLTAISRTRPDEIYHLAGQSSVGLSFELPSETIDSVILGTLNILEALRFLALPAKLYHASSSECFGDTNGLPANENTAFNPVSPYAVAKSAAHWLVRNYREAHGMFAANGILFNHESGLRPARFVTQKIIQTAYRIAQGSNESLPLGNLAIERDWGWAPEYVDAMWRILQTDQPEDYVIATGETHSLQEFVELAFATWGLDWKKHVRHDPELMRPNEIRWSQGDPSRARERLGWSASQRMGDVVRLLAESLPKRGSVAGRTGS